LRHPGIVRATDIIVEDGVAGLVMDFREGLSLEQHIAESEGGLASEAVIEVGEEILAALWFAHSRGVVHRDIKPANVIISSDWEGDPEVVLLDFGIAQVRGELRSAERGQTQLGDKMGTPGYMSPEQLRSAAEVDQRTDLFSLGVVLLEMATGRAPFHRDSDADTIVAVLAGDYSIPKELTRDAPVLAHVIDRALSTDREDRWESADTMLEALRESSNANLDAAAAALDFGAAATTSPDPVPAEKARQPEVVDRPGGALGLALLKLASAVDSSGYTAYVVPEFDQAKLGTAVRSFVPPDFGEVLVHIDSTVFGGAKEGLILTSKGVCRKEIFEPPICIPFTNIEDVTTVAGDPHVTFSGQCANRGEFVEFREALGSFSAAMRLAAVIQLLRGGA